MLYKLKDTHAHRYEHTNKLPIQEPGTPTHPPTEGANTFML